MSEAMLSSVTKQSMDFERLDMIVKSGLAKYTFDIGSTISFKLKNGRDVVARVVDFDVYREHEVIFVMEDAYWQHNMNSRDTNAGGWAQSDMYDFMGTILDEFPDELAKIIKPRIITQHLRNGETSSAASKLWVPSVIEVGEDYLSEQNRQRYREQEPDNKQFEWFKTPRNRIKSLLLEDGTKETLYSWWGRSPIAAGSTYFVPVHYYGNPSNYLYDASGAYGVVVGFSI